MHELIHFCSSLQNATYCHAIIKALRQFSRLQRQRSAGGYSRFFPFFSGKAVSSNLIHLPTLIQIALVIGVFATGRFLGAFSGTLTNEL